MIPLLWQKSRAWHVVSAALVGDLSTIVPIHLQKLKYVIAHIKVDKFRVQASKVGIIYVLKDERRRFTLPISDDVE